MTQKLWGVRVRVACVGENSENSEIYLLKLDTRENVPATPIVLLFGWLTWRCGCDCHSA